MLIKMRFIKKEVKHNYEILEAVNKLYYPLEMTKNFTYDEFIEAYRDKFILRDKYLFETNHFDKFKYEIAYMENVFANEIIDFYDLFELIKAEDYTAWSEEEFEFFKETLNNMLFFLVSDYDHWGGF